MSKAVQKEVRISPEVLVYLGQVPAKLVRRPSVRELYRLEDRTGQAIKDWELNSWRKLEDPDLVTEEEHKKSITSAA